MEDVDRAAIRESKDVCGGCGASLREVGEIEADGRRGDEYECSR